MYCEAALADQRHRTDALVGQFRAALAGAPGSDHAGGGMVVGDASAATSFLGGPQDDRKFYGHYKGWTYSAIRPIAQTIAGLPLRIARERRKEAAAGRGGRRPEKAGLPLWLRDRSENLELYEQHELLELLDNPNPLMVRWHLLSLTVTQLDLTGKQHWWVTKSKGKRILWPLPATWVTPIHTKEEAFAKWELRPGGTGEPIAVPREEIVYFYYPSPKDPLDAFAPLQAMGNAVSADEHMETAQGSAFQNGVHPKVAFIAGDLSDEDAGDMGRPLLEREQRERIVSMIKRHYAGVVHYDEPIILDRLIRDVKILGRTPREMDFTGSGRFTKARITQGIGTNPAIMGEIEGLNRASSATARRHFADFTVNPKVDLISQILTTSMGPLFARPNEKLVVWVEQYRPDDREEKRKDVGVAAKHGAISRNEIRSILLGLDSLQEGGDDIPVAPTAVLMPVRSAKANGSVAKAITLDRATYRDVWLKANTEAEAALAATVEALFTAQRDDVIRQLQEVGVAAPELVDLVFRPQEWHERFIATLGPVVLGLMLEGAHLGLAAVKSRGGLQQRAPAEFEDLLIDLPPNVASGIRSEFDTIMEQSFSPDIQQVTRRRLADTLTEAVANGENLYEMTVRIGDGPTVAVGFGQDGVLGSASNTIRATLIARTETTGAMNGGHQAAMDGLAQDGLIDGKEWLSTVDQYTRPRHLALGNESPIPVRGMFQVGNYRVPYPGHHSLPAEDRCNCRCTTIAVHLDVQEAATGRPVTGCLVHGSA